MQRLENFIIVIAVILWLWFLLGCTPTFQERQHINYDVAIVELDNYGKKKKVWIPEPSSVYVYLDDDTVVFIDGYTGEKKKIEGSYKFLSNKK